MLDAPLMIIEVLSTDFRAPPVGRQRELIRADGTRPEREFSAPSDLHDLPLLLKKGEGDVVCIAHPKVFGSSAAAALVAISRSDAMLKLPHEYPFPVDTEEQQDAFLALAASTPWGKGSRKQIRNPGRPPKRKQPTTDQKARYERMWFNPDTYKPRHILALASDDLDRAVELWEFKHWFGPSRTRGGGNAG